MLYFCHFAIVLLVVIVKKKKQCKYFLQIIISFKEFSLNLVQRPFFVDCDKA
jgi:hypothetical protein